MTLTITTFDRVPDFVLGHARDLRIRWACEEAGRPYLVDTVSVTDRSPEHFARQPFGLTPMLRDGDQSIFESGAILIHLGETSDILMPVDPVRRLDVLQWLIACISSVEAPVWAYILAIAFDKDMLAAARPSDRALERLGQLEAALGDRAFLAAGQFSVADIMLTHILRMAEAAGLLSTAPGLVAYLRRMTARPAFQRALTAQIEHFTASAQTQPPAQA